MAIAIYRYCCVFYNNWLLDIFNKKILERSILLYVASKWEIPLIYASFPLSL